IVPAGSGEAVLKKVHGIFSQYYEAHCLDKTKPYDGISKMLQRLKNSGVKTAVATNKDHVFSVKLIKDFFGGNIDCVCGRRDGIPKKPDPYIVNLLIQQLNADKSETLYVGDSNVDMETALNSQLDSCGVLWGFRTEKELLESGARHIAENADKLWDLIMN
ncbi:MAG: HAD family hydrolase, partial [[Eubacterium] siraeum]|nr:HAD family hydrolase [[Eubacterium] siraeum]